MNRNGKIRLRNRQYTIRNTLFGLVTLLLVAAQPACGPRAPSGPKIRAEGVWSRPAVAMTMEEMPTDESTEGGGETKHGGHAESGTGAVFLTLVNEGQEDDRLISARTDVAEAAEIHQTTMEGDVMRMQRVAAIEVPAGGQVGLKPGGYHIMLIGLQRDLEVGDRFLVTLTFEKSGTVTVEAEVRQP